MTSGSQRDTIRQELGVLLDTTYLYRLMASDALFSPSERQYLAEREASVHVSAVSIWEARIKYGARHRSGARKSPFDPESVFEALKREKVVFLPLTAAHAARALEVPLRHKDPFDELLVTQAQVEGLRFLTIDKQLVDHPLAITVR